ncbi:MAG: hypothetical protein QNJ75_03950 [Acidimicrobiia bacterium]|nr:hypothetical protein [Acidimicrobiia bacterium]
MLLRIRWFIMGAVASVGAVSYIYNQLRKARERLTARNIANAGARGVGRALEAAGAAIRPKGEQ